MIRRTIAVVLLVALAATFGLSVHRALANMRTQPRVAIKPTEARPNPFTLPGTVVVAQRGGVYQLKRGVFKQLPLPSGTWSQPAAIGASAALVLVQRAAQFSDLYRYDLASGAPQRLTDNAGDPIDSNHWAFYPVATADGSTVFYSYDSPKEGYRVDLAIWARPLQGGEPVRWTDPNPYTGGDVSPVPLAGGGILYAGFSFDTEGHVYSQIFIQRRPLGPGEALTDPKEDCRQPALSPDGTRLAITCTGGAQAARVEIAPFDGAHLGAREVLVDNVMASSPTWAPDGHSLLYMAPAAPSPGFQLFWLPLDADAVPTPGPSPSPTPPGGPIKLRVPRQMTADLDLDATSGIVWLPASVG